MALNRDDAIAMVADDLLAKWQTERRKLNRIDQWARWDHESPHKPRSATPEYKELSSRAQAPWGSLVVSSVSQTLYVEGYGRPDEGKAAAGNDGESPAASGWRKWQANGWDARQLALHWTVLAYGLAYGTALPGRTLSGESMPVMRGVSPREMIALYDDPADDEWPELALRVRRKSGRFRLALFDDEFVHHLVIGSIGDRPVYVREEVHDAGVCPVVRYTNRFDLEGRAAGEIEPFIPILGRIDQTVFDRLVVQRFASWIVRTIAGMDLTKSAEEAGISVASALLRLQQQDILVASSAEARFGSLPATPMDGFVNAEDRDLTDLAAVSQTPAFELGKLANMSAEALAAARASQTAKSSQVQHSVGESHEQLIRLAEHIDGNRDGASDFMAQVRWADTSIRSLSQAADGLGKLAQMLGIPPEVLWRKVPGLTQQDIDEAKAIVERNGGLAKVFEQITAGVTPTPGAP